MTWLSAKMGEMYRLFSWKWDSEMTLLSSGAMVGSPDRPARLKMALVGDTTAFWRRTHSSVSVRRGQALVGNHHPEPWQAVLERPAASALSRQGCTAHPEGGVVRVGEVSDAEA